MVNKTIMAIASKFNSFGGSIFVRSESCNTPVPTILMDDKIDHLRWSVFFVLSPFSARYGTCTMLAGYIMPCLLKPLM